MRFLHVADLHLGLRVTRFGAKVNGRVQEARIEALDHLLAQVPALKLDFLLIAGDLFDDNHVDLATARRAFELLEAARVPTYVLPGNHDPLTVDSVYGRAPWNTSTSRTVYVLREAEPTPIPGGTLFPCPLRSKNSFDDPTHWIPARAKGDASIRIGLAHGSLRCGGPLSPDDHVIDRNAADLKGLDYLALGHWHCPSRHADRAGVVRTVYPGVHEPMRFFENPEFATGWAEYSHTHRNDLFTDDGKGHALIVTIDPPPSNGQHQNGHATGTIHPASVPVIEDIITGRLQWHQETHELHEEAELAALIDRLSKRESGGNHLLRLCLHGTLSAQAMLRLDELDAERAGGQGGVLSRYLWAELDADRLVAEPTDAELQHLAGNGVVRAVYDRLRAETQSPDPAVRQVAWQSLLLLYGIATGAR
jgi:DNA repair exonuclease SbcCD nuclease subunit